MAEIKIEVTGTLFRLEINRLLFYYCTNIGTFLYDPEDGGVWTSTDYSEWELREVFNTKKKGSFHPVNKLQFLVETGVPFESFQIGVGGDNEEM